MRFRVEIAQSDSPRGFIFRDPTGGLENRMRVCRVCPEHMAEKQLEPTQPVGSLDMANEPDVDDESSSSSSSGDSEGRVELLRSAWNTGVAAKRPHGGLREPEEEEELQTDLGSFLVLPDVGAYLANFRLDPQQQIALCRTWANYLAAKNRPTKYQKKKE